MIHWKLMLVLPLALAVGCSGADMLEEDASLGEHGRFGLVYVSYDHDWAESGDAVVLTSTAQFVRYSAMDREQVARLLALPLHPDRDLPALDRCQVYDLSVDVVAEEALESEETGSVELLEAGDLSIQIEGRTVTLSPRHFPWLLPFISGVVYGEAQSSAVEKVSGVKVSAAGGAVGSFTAQVASPELPRLVQVGAAEPAPLVSVAPGEPLALRWAPAASGGADVTYAELRFTRGKRDMALRCRVRDDGAFELPATSLGELAGKVTLEVVRLRRSFFDTAGLESGELRVAVRDTVTIEL